MGRPNFVSLARVAKKCNSNAGLLAKQIKSGVWGPVQLVEGRTKRSEKRLSLPYGQATVLVAFHKWYAPLETVAKKLGQNNKRVKRVLEGINRLPDNHAAFAHIGGKIGVKKVGGYRYIELEHAPRLKSAITEFISIEQASREINEQAIREIGMGRGILSNLLTKGFWPEAGLVSFGTRSRWVHHSVVKQALAFVRNHYSLSEAAARAKISPSGFWRWIAEWGFPSVRLPAKLNDSYIFVPKNGFKQLVRAFKQGKKAAEAMAEEYRPPKQYGTKELLKKFDLKEKQIAVDAARVLNACGTRIHQLSVESNLERLAASSELNLATNIKSAYLRLLLEGGGAASPLGRGINALVQTHLDPGKPTYWTGALNDDEELKHERQFKRGRGKYEIEEEADMGGQAEEMRSRMQKAQAALSKLLQTGPLSRFEMLKKMLLPSAATQTKSSPGP